MERKYLLDLAVSRTGGKRALLAKALDVTEPTVGRWFSGDSRPEYEMCLRLAKLTGVAASLVLETFGFDASLLPAADAPAEHKRDPRLATLMQIVEAGWQRAGDEKRAIADNVIRGFFSDHLPAPGERRQGGTAEGRTPGGPNARNGRHEGVVMRFRSAAKPPSRQLTAGMRA